MTNKATYLILANRKSHEFISYSDILYLESDLNYTKIHLQNGVTKLSSRTMGYHIQHFLDDTFIRIHRSYCVNKNHITSFDYPKDPEYLILVSGKELSISRRKKRGCLSVQFH